MTRRKTDSAWMAERRSEITRLSCRIAVGMQALRHWKPFAGPTMNAWIPANDATVAYS